MGLLHGEELCFDPRLLLLTHKQFFGLQLDRGNLSNALTDNLLADLNLTSNDYNNVSASR